MSRPRPKPFTVAVIQDGVAPSADATLAATVTRIRDAHARGAQIICLKELFNAPYFCKKLDAGRFDLAEPVARPDDRALRRLAKELAVVLVVPFYEKQAAGVYRNSAAVIDADGTLLGLYRKMHIPHDPMFEEKYYFAPGESQHPVQPRGVPGPPPRPAASWCGRPATHHRRAHLLGPVVSGGGAHHRAARRGHPVLSHGHRLAPGGEGRMGTGAGGGMAHGAARARHRQRRLRGIAQPGGARARGRHRRHRVLRPLVDHGPVRTLLAQAETGTRRWSPSAIRR
jgi:hypothetical protein